MLNAYGGWGAEKNHSAYMSISGCGSRLLSSSLYIRFLSIMAENPGAKRPRDKEEETNIPKMHSRFPWSFMRSSTSGSGREKSIL